MKMEGLALVKTTPLSLGDPAMNSIWSLSSSIVERSKTLAEDSGRSVAVQHLAGKFLRSHRLEHRQHLRRKRFVDLDEVSLGESQTGLRFGLVNGKDWAQSHPRRVATGVSVTGETTQWREPQFV